VWIITAWQHISPELTVKGFKKCCISNAMDGTDDLLLNDSEEDQNVRSECEKMKALTEEETVTLIGEGI
jgi:hypothetical protein